MNMKSKWIFVICLIFLLPTMVLPATMVNAANSNYVSNRVPLIETPFVALPLGTVRPKGWLLTQLQLQKSGLTGYAESIYPELGSNSAWLGGNAVSSDWERPPYYVRGLVALAYTLNDESLKNKAKRWIDWSINSQKSNGFFGPSNQAWWSRMPMLNAIRDYYEATGDSRVLNFLKKYFQYQNNTTLPNSDLLDYWGQSRVIDNIDAVLWLYNRTGDSFLMTLADKLKNNSDNWTAGFNSHSLPNTHIVNVSEGYKFPAVWYQKSLSSSDRSARREGHNYIMNTNGMVIDQASGTEFFAGLSSTQGTEQCGIVERIWSDSLSMMIFGDAYIGDNIEKLAFNALPATLSKTSRQHQYYIVPNQAQSKVANHGYAQDYTNGLTPSWQSGWPCCCFNWHMGWPKFTQYSWAATNDNGLAIMTYAPTEVNAKVGNGVSVKFVEDTHYPFEEEVRLRFTSAESVSFPLKLRIPGWCTNPSIKINGVVQTGISANSFYNISRIWSNNDTVIINFPMTIKAVSQINNSKAIVRGPLVFSLKLNEKWTLNSSKTISGLDFSQYEVTPTSSWNYALALNNNNPSATMKVNVAPMTDNPFIQSTTPITIIAKAKQLNSWYMGNNTLPKEVPSSPVNPNTVEENVTLVPFGAENIRITYFPYYNSNDGGMPTPVFSGDSYDLTGSNYFETPMINISGNQPWTMAAWVYQRGTRDEKDPAYQYYRPNPNYKSKCVMGWGAVGTKTATYIDVNPVKLVTEYGFNSDQTNYETAANYSHYTWYHLTNTYDGITQRIYINGRLVKTNTPGTLNLANAKVQIGRDPFGQNRYFAGKIQQVKIYNAALTETQVSSLVTSLPSPLNGYGLISAPPASLNLNQFYKKYYKSELGIHIISSNRVGDHSLVLCGNMADEAMKKIKANLPAVYSTMLNYNARICIQSYMEQTTDIPEWKNLTDANYARGMGGVAGSPLSGSGEEGIQREPFSAYGNENIPIHEFGHSIHGHGLYYGANRLYNEVNSAFNEARNHGLWANTYTGSNVYEYFAGGIQFWYNVGAQSANGQPDGVHNHVNTRIELQNYDQRLYNIMAQLFDTTLLPSPWTVSN